jgi:FkbM family methyltransferase
MLGNGGDEEMKPLPFKMRTETPMEKYRRDSFWEKEYETLEWIRSFSPHDVFFDVGANVGIYSLFCASLFPGMTIAAFEPHPGNFTALLDNIRANQFSIVALHWAVGSRNDYIRLDIPEGEAGKTGAQMTDRPGEVFCVKVDSVGETGPLNIKIDIDGQELEVVKGMQNTLPHIKSALIEVSKASKGPIMEIMLKARFTTDNRFNAMSPHSRERRAVEGIDAENIIFTR